MYRLRDPNTPASVKDRLALRLLKTEKPDLEAKRIEHTIGNLGERMAAARGRVQALSEDSGIDRRP
jgi:hypothetical protein